MIYCRACGLWMSNGFCPHGSVDQAKMALAEQREGLEFRPRRPGMRRQGKR